MFWIPVHHKPLKADETPIYTNTDSAHYIINDVNGSHKITINQSDSETGGDWRLISNRVFIVNSLSSVQLTDQTDDEDRTNKLVIADAVKFVPDTAQEIYSSPVTGTLADSTPVVYTTTIDQPLSGVSNAPDTGSVVCVNATNNSINVANEIWRYPRSAALRDPLEGPIENGFFSTPVLAWTKPDAASPAIPMLFAAGMDRQIYSFDTTGVLRWKGPGLTKSEIDTAIPIPWVQTAKTRNDAFGGQFITAPAVKGAGVEVAWDFPNVERKAVGEPAADANSGYNYYVYVWIPAEDGTPRSFDASYTITYTTITNGAPNPAGKAIIQIDQSSPDNQGRWVKLGTTKYFNVSRVTLSNGTKFDENVVNNAIVVADAVMIVPSEVESFGYCTPAVDNLNVKDPTDAANNIYAVTSNGRVLDFDGSGKLKWIFPQVKDSIKTNDAVSLGDMVASPAFATVAGSPRLYVAGVNGDIHSLVLTDADAKEETGWPYEAYPGSDDQMGFTSSPTVESNIIYAASTEGEIFALKADASVLWTYPMKPLNPADPTTPAVETDLGAFRYSTPSVATDNIGVKRLWIGSSDGLIYSFEVNNSTSKAGFTNQGVKAVGYTEPSLTGAVYASAALDGSAVANGPNMFVGNMNGVFRWFKAGDGDKFDFATHNGWQTAGQLFSSPAITHTSGKSVVLVGGSDGRIYAFSDTAGGGTGGDWMGGDTWDFETPYEAMATKAADPSLAEYQFDLFDRNFFARSNFDTTFDATGTRNNAVTNRADTRDPIASQVYTAPDAVFVPPAILSWIVSKEMRLVDGDKYDLWDETTDPLNPVAGQDGKVDKGQIASLATELTGAAKARRKAEYLLKVPNSNPPTPALASNNTYYFEWGESMYAIVWNLPAKREIYGSSDSSKMRSITISFFNGGVGSSSGNTIKGVVKRLEEYHILNSKKPAVDPNTGNPVVDGYDKLLDSSGFDIMRTYALVQLDIKASGSNAYTPSRGWRMNLEVRKQSTATPPVASAAETIPLAQLEDKGTYYDLPKPPLPIVPARLGINNPLAIGVWGSVNSPIPQKPIAWGTGVPDRDTPYAHINGNPTDISIMPEIFLGGQSGVAHGTSSVEHLLAVMDRSAMGMSNDSIQRFRITGRDLTWHYGIQGLKLPWEGNIHSQDYPDLYSKYENYRTAYDDKDPSKSHTELPRAQRDPKTFWDPTYENSTLQPDTVFISVDVPRYQPANTGDLNDLTQIIRPGYNRILNAFVDSNGDGNFDSGSTVRGRPSVNQEAYRRFRLGALVPPDPHIVVEEQVIDIGIAGHGLGEPGGNIGQPWEFLPWNNNPTYGTAVQSWFKPLTIKNEGNVNLWNVRVSRSNLWSDPFSISSISGSEIVSSLDKDIQRAEPFSTELPTTFQDVGYVISKPRVGDADPTTMTIPDQKKFDAGFAVGSIPEKPKLSVRIPVGQPVGTYVGKFLEVFSDTDDNDKWQNGEPYAAPGFDLKVAVKEAQLTGNPIDKNQEDASLYQIDEPDTAASNFVSGYPRVGDTTPAAYMDNNGNLRLYWSGNRLPVANQNLYPDWNNSADPNLARFASAPWFINFARLDKNPPITGVYEPADPNGAWWEKYAQYPLAPTPVNGDNKVNQWPSTLVAYTDPNLYEVKKWDNTGLLSVRHTSPSVVKDIPNNKNWIIWSGTADIRNKIDNTVSYENRLFYGDAGDNGINEIFTMDWDSTKVKRSPALSLTNNNSKIWMFWQSGGAGRWTLDYSLNAYNGTINRANWSPAARLRLPDSLNGVSSPNGVARPYGNGSQWLIDMVFSGTSRVNSNSDIFLTRYVASGNGESMPSRRAQPLARVFAERLERDTQYGFYTSKNIAWVRLDAGQVQAGAVVPSFDKWGAYDTAAQLPDQPYIYIQLGDGYTKANGYPIDMQGYWVSATDGSIFESDKTTQVAPPTVVTMDEAIARTEHRVLMKVDQATGVYSYSYAYLVDDNGDPSPLKDILGETLVDFSAGVVRFTKPLKEVRPGKITRVYADYTPQTLRITTDKAVDNSPKAFLDQTNMRPLFNKAMDPTWDIATKGNAPIDRLWVLWRKAGISAKSSTVYLKSYRVGVDLTKIPGAKPILLTSNGGIPMDNSTSPATPKITMTGNIGPWEIDRTGTKIFFTTSDERYRSLGYYGSTSALGGYPGPITIDYVWDDLGGSAEQTATLELTDISWIEEIPEQSLFGFAADTNVNEGSIYGFPDSSIGANEPGKLHLFWSSTRSGVSNLFWETFVPGLTPK